MAALELDILKKDIPAVYEIGLKEGSPGLTVRIHKKTIEAITPALNNADALKITYLQQTLGLQPFIPLSEKKWGFGEVIEHLDEDERWVIFGCAFPEQKIGQSIPWQLLYETSASLQLLFNALALTDIITEATRPQLMHLRLITLKKQAGGSLRVFLSRTMAAWLREQPDRSAHTEGLKAMVTAYKHLRKEMLGEVGEDDPRFRAQFRDQSILLVCPGNTCSLVNEDYKINPERGHQLAPGNVDNPIQQLTLLAGVAALHQSGRDGIIAC